MLDIVRRSVSAMRTIFSWMFSGTRQVTVSSLLMRCFFAMRDILRIRVPRVKRKISISFVAAENGDVLKRLIEPEIAYVSNVSHFAVFGPKRRISI